MSPLTIGELLARAAAILRNGGISSPRLDAEVLLAFLLDKSRTGLYNDYNCPVPGSKIDQYLCMVERRLKREPVAYITGEKEFMSLMFKVNRDVLIPRPETELLVEEAIGCKPVRVLDIGTGSGAIAVSLAYCLPESRVWAVDISPKALEIARFNACRHNAADRVSFLAGNLGDPLHPGEFNGFFDLITANLPYIPTSEMDSLPEDVKDYEPRQALDGGPDGLMYYRELAPAAYRLLREDGYLLLETGWNQADELTRFLRDVGFHECCIRKDLAGLDRVLKARKQGHVNGSVRRLIHGMDHINQRIYQ